MMTRRFLRAGTRARNVTVTFLNVPLRYCRSYATFQALDYFFEKNSLDYPNLNVV